MNRNYAPLLKKLKGRPIKCRFLLVYLLIFFVIFLQLVSRTHSTRLGRLWLGCAGSFFSILLNIWRETRSIIIIYHFLSFMGAISSGRK